MINSFFQKSKHQAGFTLIEMIVVFSIIVILSAVGIVASVSYSRAQALAAAVENIKTILNQAKSYAQSQYKPSECNNGVLEKYRVNIGKDDGTYTFWVICQGEHQISQGKLPKDVSFATSTSPSDYFEFPVLRGGIMGDDQSVSPWEIKLSGASDKYKIITVDKNGTIQ
jgi:prepilin-type N-terminal cleavage/methylation domain-containing protein